RWRPETGPQLEGARSPRLLQVPSRSGGYRSRCGRVVRMHDANVVVLTPVKDAADLAADYFERLGALTYPLDRIDVALLESDSRDGTYDAFCAAAALARPRF